jgi:hypothetical protein
VLASLPLKLKPPSSRPRPPSSHPRPPPDLARPRVLVYTMGKNKSGDRVDCTVPTPPMPGGPFAGLGLFSACLHRFRREFRKRHRDALDRDEIVDVSGEECYLLGVAAAAPGEAWTGVEIKSSTRRDQLCFESSPRAIDSSKNQPNRSRFGRAREFWPRRPRERRPGRCSTSPRCSRR